MCLSAHVLSVGCRSQFLSIVSFETGSLNGPKVQQLARQAGYCTEWSTCLCVPSPAPCAKETDVLHHYTQLLCGSGDMNSSPHANMTDTLLTEPFPQTHFEDLTL